MPRYTYSVTIQLNGGSKRHEVDPFDQYRTFLTESLRMIDDEVTKEQREAVQKNGAILRGGMAHFLSTPLKSDKDEIVRLIEESILRAVQQMDQLPAEGPVPHALWRILEPQEVPLQRQLVGVMKRLLKNGRTALIDAGCMTGKNAGEIAVSQVTFERFALLSPICKAIDRLPSEIELSMMKGNVRTVISASGDLTVAPHLLAIDFGRLSDAALTTVIERSASLMEQFGAAGFSLQRSILHSSSPIFQLLIAMDVRKTPLGTALMSLIGENAEIEDALTANGSVQVMEKRP